MNKITINHGTFQVDERILDHGTITLGRTADNDVQIEDDTVSAHHAKIVTLFNASHVEDLGSTNGTYVNGRRIVKHTLHSGDIISAGGYQIVFYSDQGVPKKAPDKTVMMSSARLEAMIEASGKHQARGAQPDPNPATWEPQSGDTVIAMDDDEAPAQQHGALRSALAHSQHHQPAARPGGAVEVAHRTHAPAGNNRRSWYLTIAITVVIALAVIAIILRA